MRSVLSPSLLCLASCLAACGSEDANVNPSPAADAGTDAVSDTTPDTTPDATPDTTPDATPDATPESSTDAPDVISDVTPDATEDAEPDAQPAPRIALFVASNYASAAEMIAFDLDQPDVVGHLISDDQDSLVDADQANAFLLRRTVGEVAVLDSDEPWNVKHTIDVNPSTGSANPWAVVVPAGDKAYVVRYGQNSLSVIDPTAGTLLGEIDLSDYVIDADGLVDAFAGVFDPATNRAYIGLQRVNQFDFGSPPDYVHTCVDTYPLLIGIDTTDDSIVDLNGAEDGEGLEFKSYNPWRMLWDQDAGRILLLSIGCAKDDNGTSIRARRGIEAVDPSTGASEWLWSFDGLDRPADLIWISPTQAVVGLDDATFSRHWYAWDPTSSALGNALTGVPDVPVWDDDRGLVGLSFGTTSLDVVRYDLDTGSTSVLVPNAFDTSSVFPTSSTRHR
jgi:hypothetical protein